MKLSWYIAKRYLFAKKSRNAINVISAVSVSGVGVGTMALIIILSVFNGLEKLVSSIFNTFDPDLKITAVEGKSFMVDSVKLKLLSEVNGVCCWSVTVEENALLKYGESQYIATIKGVDDNYIRVSGISEAMWDGEFELISDMGRMYAVPGIGVANSLGLRINFITPLVIYTARRTGSVTMNPENAFIRRYIYPSGIFQVEQEYDSKYVYVPIGFARELLEYDENASSIEVRFDEKADPVYVQRMAASIFGEDFLVRNRYEQQEIFYKVMRSERVAIFLILTLIIIIASFNIIGSLTMLIIEKERDIGILKSLGADNNLIRRIFIFEGWLISIIGTVAGIIAGFVICWLQQTYGLVKLQGESLVMDAYPVVMEMKDFLIVPATVLTIGYWAAWYPVRYLTKKYLSKNEKNP